MKPAGLVPHGRSRLGIIGLACVLFLLLAAAPGAIASPGSVKLSTSQTDPVVGESVTYTANVSGGNGPFTYQFSLDGSPATSPSSSNTYTTSFSSAATHSVGVTVHDAKPDSEGYTYLYDTKSVTAVPAMSASVTSSAESSGVGDPITFSVNDAAGGKAPLGIIWDKDGNGFNDGGGTSITTSFSTPGVKTVRAHIVDNAHPAHGLTVSKDVTIGAGSCLKHAAFALVEVTTQGCLDAVGSAAVPRYETSSAVKVNGIPFPAPPSGKKFVATGPTDADPGGRIGIAGTTITLGGLTVFSGDVDWALPAGGQGDEAVLKTVALPSDQKLFGLQLVGEVSIKLGFRADGTHYATFPLHIELPDVFKTGPDQAAGGATGDAALRVDEAGVHYDGLKLQASNVYVGKLKVESVCFSFVPSGSQAVESCPVPSLGGAPFLECNEDVNTDRWDGNAVLELPTQSKTRLAVFGGVADERLSKLGGFVDNLGTTVPIVPGVYLNRVGVGLCVYPPPFKLKGDVGVNVLPAGGKSTVSVDGYFLYTDAFQNDPWSLEMGGSVSVLDRQLGSGKVIIRPTGSIDFSLQASFDLFSVVSIDGSVVGWIEIPHNTFNVDGNVHACISALCADSDTVVSSTGLAGCLNLGTITWYVLVEDSDFAWYAPWRIHWEARHIDLQAGFGHRWSDSSVDLFASSCNLGPYRATRSSAARVGSGRVFKVASHTPAIALNVMGRDGPPKVKLTGPGGAVITSPADAASVRTPSYVLAENPTESSTSVLLINPKPGSWTVEAADGGDSVIGLQTAAYQAPANFRGTVVRRPKGKRALGVSYSLPPGSTLDFVERGKGVEHVIAHHVKGKRCPGPDSPRGQKLLCFRKTFSPRFGAGGRRKVLALVARDGIPLSTTTVATFTVAKPGLPGRPRGLLVERRRGATVVAAFRRSARASGHTLSIELSTGKRFGVQLSTTRCTVVRLTHIPRSVRVHVHVAGVRRDLQVGPYAQEAVPRKARQGDEHGKLPKRTCASASGA